MADDQIQVDIVVNSGNSVSEIKKVTAGLENLGKAGVQTTTGTARVVSGLDSVTTAASKARRAWTELGDAQVKATRAAQVPGVKGTGALAPANTPNRRATRAAGPASATPAAITAIPTTAFDPFAGVPVVTANLDDLNNSLNNTSKASNAVLTGLPRLRYAMHDVANTAALLSASMAVIPITAATMAIKAERSFADVARTTGVAGVEAEKLRQEFVKMNQSMPTSWAELTDIGTLAGQLGVANDKITSFTESVVKFSTTSNVSASESATAFARLDELLIGVNGNYEALGSAILKVGTNSAATESEIIAVAQQIAPVANMYNFSADAVIGFAGALASVKVPPELSRGMLQRMFAEVNQAISSGSTQLAEYGSAMGTSGEAFKKAWLDDSVGTLAQLLKGIGEQGGAAEGTLVRLGLTSSRDAATVKRLAQTVDSTLIPALNDSASAYSSADEMTKQYDKIVETLAERLNILANNFQQFLITMGGGVSVFGGLIDAAAMFLKWMTDFAATPFGAVFLGIGVGATALAAIFLIVASAVFRLRAGMLAWVDVSHTMKTKMAELRAEAALMSGTMNGTSSSVNRMGSSLKLASAGLFTFSGALKAAMSATAITAAIAAITWAITELGNAMKSTEDRAKEMFDGQFGAIRDAMLQDAEAARNGAEGYIYLEDALAASVDTMDDWNVMMGQEGEEAKQKRVAELAAETEALTGSIQKNTYAIGENARAIIGKAVAESDQFKKLVEYNKNVAAIGAPQLDLTGYLNMATSGDQMGIDAMLAEYSAKITTWIGGEDAKKQAYLAANGGILEGMLTGGGNIDPGKNMQGLFDIIKAALGEVAAQEIINQYVTGTEKATSATEDWVKSLDDVIEGMKQVAEQVQKGFAFNDTIDNAATSMQDLFQGIADGGNSFSALNEAGQTNINNLQNALLNVTQLTQMMGLGAAEGVAIVFKQLQDSGVQTADLVSYLNGQVQAGIISATQMQAIIAGTFQLSTSGAALNNVFAAISSGTKKVGGGAAKAKQEIRTLIDYANDLAKVFSRAFEIRFSGIQALDKITAAFSAIAQATADAREEIDGLNADISKLTADRALQEYFLKVATSYGDQLKAAEIRANISSIDADLASKSKALARAQLKTNKTLVGTSDAAIDNRSEIIGLVGDYQDYIKALASSGMNEDQLRAKTAQLKSDFMAQAIQLGYNSDELGQYAAAFDDVTVAINNVPRNITVTADTDPAIQSLNEFLAYAKQKADQGVTVSTSVDSSGIQKAARGIALLQEAASLKKQYDDKVARGVYGPFTEPTRINQINAILGSNNFASGGYTGAGGKYQPAGIVHRGEYVVPKEQVNQSTGLPYYMSQPRSFAQGGYVGGDAGGMVSLSPEDRALLRNVGGSGNIVLYADSKELARSVNDGNRQIVASGGRP